MYESTGSYTNFIHYLSKSMKNMSQIFLESTMMRLTDLIKTHLKKNISNTHDVPTCVQIGT